MMMTKLPKYWHLYCPPDRSLLIACLILLPVHFALAKLATVFSFPDGTVAIWPPIGVFLAILLIWEKRLWLAIWLCDFVVEQALFYSNPLLSAVIALLNVLEPLIVSLLIERFIRRYPFNRAIDAIKFIVLLVPYPILSGALGIASQCIDGYSAWGNFVVLWQSWFISSIVSMLIITPILLAWLQPDRPNTPKALFGRSLSRRLYIGECLLIAGMLSVIGYFSFWQNLSVEYMMILPLLWAAFRLRQQEVTLLILFAIGVAVVGTAQGYGSFAGQSVAESIVLLQSFMSALSIATLVLAAAVQENRISAAQLQRANDELEERVEARTAELTQTLQKLQATQSQLIQQEKMSSLGQLVAGIAHEINNPVNFIHGNLNYLKDYAQDLLDFVQLYQTHHPNPNIEIQHKAEEIDLEFLQDDLVKILGSMKLGTDRIREIVLSLRKFSRVDESEFKAVDIHEGIDSTLLILHHRLKANSDRPEIIVIKQYSDLPLVECYPGQLNQVFMNVLANAIDALEEVSEEMLFEQSNQPRQPDRCITISTSRSELGWVQIAISDNGSGMTELTRQQIFRPFFTTKSSDRGTGMGMSISYQIITEKHQGKLECTSTLGQGTKFLIQIPIQQP